MHWGHLRLFYAATFPLNWYKMACMGDILHRLIWMKFISMLSMFVQFVTHAFSLKNYCDFNTKSYCSDVCGYHQCPQALAKICRNMGTCCSFRALAAREKYPGFILLFRLIIICCQMNHGEWILKQEGWSSHWRTSHHWKWWRLSSLQPWMLLIRIVSMRTFHFQWMSCWPTKAS